MNGVAGDGHLTIIARPPLPPATLAPRRVTMDAGELQAYLSTHLGPLQVTSLHRTFPGHSRETWIVDTDLGGLVVRVDHPGGPLVPIPMKVEYDVYERLWSVADPGGRAALVRRGCRVRRRAAPHGASPGRRRAERARAHRSRATTDADVRRAVCFEMAEKLAAVHTLDWRSYGFDEILFTPSDPGRALAEEIHHWRALWAESRTDPFPMITEATYWLEEQLPPGGERLSLLKGNNGVGEEIWKDGRIVALSDWELASIGEPALDWAFSQGLLALHDLDDTLAHYAEHAGFEIDRRAAGVVGRVDQDQGLDDDQRRAAGLPRRPRQPGGPARARHRRRHVHRAVAGLGARRRRRGPGEPHAGQPAQRLHHRARCGDGAEHRRARRAHRHRAAGAHRPARGRPAVAGQRAPEHRRAARAGRGRIEHEADVVAADNADLERLLGRLAEAGVDVGRPGGCRRRRPRSSATSPCVRRWSGPST